MSRTEANFDGLVGPTHNYAGLPRGNLASKMNQGRISRPRDAALQGLEKMKAVRDLGLVQGILPPQARPHLEILRRVGFTGSDSDLLAKAHADAPWLLASAYSASAMWAANAATVTPASDTADGMTHFTPANLHTTLHRSIESETTARALKTIFSRPEHFVHHPPLPAHPDFADEGAANHTRLAYGDSAAHIFVYGRTQGDEAPLPAKFPARQTRAASEAIVRMHGLRSTVQPIFVQQAPEVIDAGVFHNDVIAVGHSNVLLHHEDAFVDTPGAIRSIDRALGGELIAVPVSRAELSVDAAVQSYLFNSQLVTLDDLSLALIAPMECAENERARAVISRLIAAADNPIKTVFYLDLRESMQNGGGPACLRLRIELSATSACESLSEAHLLTDETLARLKTWITRHYRETLTPDDLRDPALLDETRTALDELTQVLKLGGDFYPFQRRLA